MERCSATVRRSCDGRPRVVRRHDLERHELVRRGRPLRTRVPPPLTTMARASQFVDEVREVVVPRRGGRHGPLPPLLLGLTLVTGLVDAFSYLLLGHVFVANMAGNVVFL